MIRRPPRPTLFPTRRSSDLQTTYAELLERCSSAAFGESFPANGAFIQKTINGRRYWYFQLRRPRSEEHTSELQSRLHLVCRLLLEKKKKKDVYTAVFTISAY